MRQSRSIAITAAMAEERPDVAEASPEGTRRSGAPGRFCARMGRDSAAGQHRRAPSRTAQGTARRPGGDAWRMDRPGAAQVALTQPAEFSRRTTQGQRADMVAAPSAMAGEWEARHCMASVYCIRCGRVNPEGARFCSQCGTPLARGSGEGMAETTSTISLGGMEPSRPRPATRRSPTPRPSTPCRRDGAAGGPARAERWQPVPARQRPDPGRPPPGQRHIPGRRDRLPPPRRVLPLGRPVHGPGRRQPQRHIRQPGTDRGSRADRGRRGAGGQVPAGFPAGTGFAG